jgi:hypothetical protein
MSWFEQGMLWHDTWCTDGIVDCSERYFMYGVGYWSDWKGMVWVGKVSHL